MKVKRTRHKVAKVQRERINSVPVCSDAWMRSPTESSDLSAFVPDKKGFTLMELMVVIAIIVLLAGIMVPNLANRLERAKITKAEADIASIESAIAMYETDLGVYPYTGIDYLDTGLTGRDSAGVYKPADDPNWHGPYIKGIENDPWGNDYVYLKNRFPRAAAPYVPPQVLGTDYPNTDCGGSVTPPHNLSYYIYSKGKNRDTGTVPTSKDDINNWDVNKSWREAK